MIEVIFPQWDRDLFLYLNSKTMPWLDPVMIQLSSYLTWMLIFAAILGVILYKDRTQGKVAAFFLMLGVALNSILNQIVKVIIMRPRPGNDFLLDEFVFNQLENAVESYSFSRPVLRLLSAWPFSVPSIFATGCIAF
ncbi:MAG: hypothetical protein LUE93_03960 [Bacteroides sp.]|nr:hypothetical protein [Bacteroides sp.]